MTRTEKITAYCALAITLFFLSFFGAREWYAYEKRVQAKEAQIQAKKEAEQMAYVEKLKQETIRANAEMKEKETKEKEQTSPRPITAYSSPGIDTYDIAARMWAKGRGMYEKLQPEADRATLSKRSDGTYHARLPVSVRNGYGDYIMATLTATVSADGSSVYDIFLE